MRVLMPIYHFDNLSSGASPPVVGVAPFQSSLSLRPAFQDGTTPYGRVFQAACAGAVGACKLRSQGMSSSTRINDLKPATF